MSNIQRTTGGILSAVHGGNFQKSPVEFSDKEFNRFMQSIHAPRGVASKRLIYFPMQKFCIHADRKGQVSPDYGYNWREQTPAEKVFVDSFYEKLLAWNEQMKPLAEAK